jgi:hypothetical protein
MSNNKKYIILSILLFFIVSITYWYNFISNQFWFQYRQTSWTNAINYDNYNNNNASNLNEKISLYTWENWVKVEQVSRYDPEYINNWLRIRIYWTWDLDVDLDWKEDYFLETNRFWRFEIKSWQAIKGYKKIDEPNLSNFCPWESVYYWLSWSVYSYDSTNYWSSVNKWWKMDLIENESYFCPRAKNFKLVFDSKHLWKMEVWTWAIIFTYNVKNPYWVSKEIDSVTAFDNRKVYINGIIASKNVNNNSLDFNWEIWDKIQAELVVVWWELKNSLLFKQYLNKNIEKYTKVLKAINLNNSDVLFDSFPWSQKLENLLDSRDLFYYNYEWLSVSNASNGNNKGVILELWWTGDGKIEVNWEKTLIIKWWNLYINTNIYNKDKNSLLTIIVKRDETNKKNWWNIYINPNVTNIDAILIADWSILSYNNLSWVLNSHDNVNLLRKQLLIFWAISTKNTIWINKAPYWSDNYISNGWVLVDSYNYNLENLRSFEAEMVTWWITGVCNDENKIRAMWGGKNMFAGKKECYIDDAQDSDLRWSDKLSPLMIYYNPILQLKIPKILKNN